MSGDQSAAVRLCPSGVVLGDGIVPFLSGSVHYFALARNAWRPALDALAELGAHFVDTVVPWNVHETARGEFDFGEDNPRLDVVHFLSLAKEAGLAAVVRPGPRVFAELTFDGIPERVVWDEACQAQSPSGAPVIVPGLPLAYPLPSQASRAFHDEAALWLGAVSERLAPLAWPNGPIALVHLDGESASSFHRGPYDRDYHPDAIAQYRRFLTNKHKTRDVLRRVYRDPTASFESIAPPQRLETTDPDALAKHLDWNEFHEALTLGALYRYDKALRRHGFRGIPKLYGIPAGKPGISVAASLTRVVDAVTLEYSSPGPERTLTLAMRSTTELAVQARARKTVPIASGFTAGFAADAHPVSDAENAFAALTALAYGVRGFNVHMAVQRGRWIGGPIDVRGQSRPSAAFWRTLFSALERTRFQELERRTPVHILIPRSFERLVSVCQTLGPLAPELVGDGSPIDGVLEGEGDPSRGAVAETGQFIESLERILEAAHVPYATIAADTLDRSLEGALWTIVASPGALSHAFVASIAERVASSAPISVGPRNPERDDLMRLSSGRLPTFEHPAVPLVLPRGPATLAELVETTLTELDVPRLVVEPGRIRATLHHAPDGHPAVLFVINETAEFTNARVTVPGATSAEDALSGERFSPEFDRFEIPMPPRTVRFLALGRPAD